MLQRVSPGLQSITVQPHTHGVASHTAFTSGHSAAFVFWLKLEINTMNTRQCANVMPPVRRRRRRPNNTLNSFH